MVNAKYIFSGFSVNDSDEAKKFYTETLGLKQVDEKMGLRFELPGGGVIFVYQKDDHQPATFTILNLIVDDIDQTVDELSKQGIKLEIYDNMPGKQDEKGIMRGLSANMGPDIAWFKDPAGNIISVIQES